MRQRTFERQEQIVRVNIKPALGRLKLKSLTPAHVRELYREKLDAGLAPGTVRCIHTVLGKALKQAVADSLISATLRGMVKAPKPAKAEIHPLSLEQVGAFLRVARSDRCEALYVLAVTAGLREGELLDLK